MRDKHNFLSEEDRALLDRQFDIADPLEITNRIALIPANAAMPNILFRYNVTPPGGMKAGHSPHLACAFSHGAKHWKGYVVEFPDKTRALIGQNCASDHFGFKFQEVENTFTGELNRKDALGRLIVIRQCFPLAVAELRALENAPQMAAFRLYWQTLIRQFGKLGQALSSIHNAQGRLLATKKTRDRRAEEDEAKQVVPELFAKTEDTVDPHLRRLAVKRWKNFVDAEPPIWRREEVDLGQCSAWHLLKDRYNVDKLLAEVIAIAEAKEAAISEQTSDKWNNRELSENTRLLKEMISKLDTALALVSDLLTFTQPENIGRIAAWANQIEEADSSIGHLVSAEGRTLVNDETRARLELSSSFAQTKMPHIDELRSILGLPPLNNG